MIKRELTDIQEIRKLFSNDSYISPDNPEQITDPDKKLCLYKTYKYYKGFMGFLLGVRKLIIEGKGSPDLLIQHCYGVAKEIEKAGARFDIRGLKNLTSQSGPFVLVGNHMSTLETITFPAIIGSQINATYVVKNSLITGRVFGPVMRSLDPIGLDRKEPKKDLDIVLNKGKELLDNGRSIVLFPQATRAKTFDPEKFNSLGIKLAKRAKVNVIPFALKTDFWENGKLISTFGKLYPGRIIHIEFGKPMAIEGAGKKEHEEIIAFIQSRFDNWKQID